MKNIPIPNLRSNDHFIEVYCVLGEFCVILGVELGSLASQKRRSFQNLDMPTSQSVVSPQKNLPTLNLK